MGRSAPLDDGGSNFVSPLFCWPLRRTNMETFATSSTMAVQPMQRERAFSSALRISINNEYVDAHSEPYPYEVEDSSSPVVSPFDIFMRKQEE